MFNSNGSRIGGTWPSFKFQVPKGDLGTKKAPPERRGFVIQLGWIKLETIEGVQGEVTAVTMAIIYATARGSTRTGTPG